MEIKELAAISIESTFSIFLLVLAYKLYKAKINTESQGHLCKWLTWKMTTENPGGQTEL